VTGALLNNSALLLDDSGNLSKATADLLLDCGTDKTLELTQTVWDDLRTPSNTSKKVPGKEATDQAYLGGVVLAFSSTTDQAISFNVQMPHAYKLGTDIEFHAHIILPTAGAGGGEKIAREMEKFVWLQAIDRLWVNHLDAMENLRQAVGLRGYGQQDPLVEYKKEAFTSFEKLVGMIEYEVIRRIFRVQVAQRPVVMPQDIQTNIDTEDKMGLKQQKAKSNVAQVRKGSQERPGRNDPCPCGSKKKYKKCCYPKYG